MPFKLSENQILWGMILIYIAVFGTITALRHYNFQTQTWDLAAFVHSIWNAAHGRGLTNTLEQVPNHLGLHFSPFLFLLVPGYVIFQSPYFLLFVQTIAIALGALPLYFLAKNILGNNPLLLRVIVAAYLLYPGLQWANIYDFHEITFFIPIFLTALYFIETRNFLWAAIFLALSASIKEDAILAVLFVGIYLLFKTANPKSQAPNHKQAPNTNNRNSKRFRIWILEFIWNLSFVIWNFIKKKRLAIIIIFASVFYFILAVKVFMPALGGGVLRFDRYANLGATPTEIVKNVVSDPLLLPKTLFTGQKIAYLFWLFLPVLFLPFFSWRTLILLIPGLAENLLTNYPFQFSGLYHYDSILIPGIFVGAVYGLKNILEKSPDKEKFIRYILLVAAVGAFLIRSPLNPGSFPMHYFQSTLQEIAYRNMVKLVPPKVSVAAQTNLVPHLANREKIYLAGLEPEMADIVLLDAKDLFGFKEPAIFDKYVNNYMLSGQYEFHAFEDRYVILLNKKFKLTQRL